MFLELIKGSVCTANLTFFNRIKELNAFSSFAETAGGHQGPKEIYDTFG